MSELNPHGYAATTKIELDAIGLLSTDGNAV